MIYNFLKNAIKTAQIIGIITMVASTAHAKPLELFVSPKGNDAWSGLKAEPNGQNTDGPFATLEKARDVARAARRGTAPPKDGVTIYLRGGKYFRETSFTLTAADSGSASSPTVFRPYKDETVDIIGGKELTGFTPVSDPAIRERLDPAARDAVRQIDLKTIGITDYGRMNNGGQGRPDNPEMPELFVGTERMALARWPNGDQWATVKSVPDKSAGKFAYDGDRPSRWKNAEDAYLYGYWTFDWADSYEKIASIDPERHEINTGEPYPVYGITAGKRWFALNILEELDAPGEWYLDRKTGILYFWAPTEKLPNPVFSLVKGGLFSLEGASYITIRDMTLENAREDGVIIRGGSANRVAGCIIRNVGRYGVSILDATNSGVRSCDIYETGLGGVTLIGGDRKTLTSGKLYAENNEFHHLGRLLRTYKPAVMLGGVGALVSHNYIHDLPHAAIQGGGNDHIIEFNEITRVCQETGDAGAFYMGRDFTQRGNIVRHNYFHHLRTGGLDGQTGFTDVMAVYLDDCFSGVTVYGNIFIKAGRSVMIGGGRDNIVENNIIQEGAPAIHVDARAKGWAANFFDTKGGWNILQALSEYNVSQPPYSVRYPQLAGLAKDDPAFPKGNRVEKNIIIGGKPFELQDNLTEAQAGVQNNLVLDRANFQTNDKGEITLKDTKQSEKIGFKPIPVRNIGLQKDEYRKTLPAKTP